MQQLTISDTGIALHEQWKAQCVAYEYAVDASCVVLSDDKGHHAVVACVPLLTESSWEQISYYENTRDGSLQWSFEGLTDHDELRLQRLSFLADEYGYTGIDTVFSTARPEGMRNFFSTCCDINYHATRLRFLFLVKPVEQWAKRSTMCRIFYSSTRGWMIAHYHMTPNEMISKQSHVDARTFTTARDAIDYAMSQGYTDLSGFNSRVAWG